MLIAFDDTDGPDGGCTTHLAGEVLDRLGPGRQAGRPRLVRLRPENPYKTRGNAAVAVEVTDDLDPDDALETAIDVISDHARVAEGKGAGVAVFDAPPDPSWYEHGVREQIPLDEVQAALEGVPTATLGTGRGLVGALCAAAWDPASREHTFTRIAYRAPERWGTPRRLDPDAARDIEQAYPETFDCYDPDDAHAVIAPRTPCPVLYAIRATRPDRLDEAACELSTEPEARAVTFVTNQASDDHLTPADLVPVEVTATPQTLEGGHVRVPAETLEGEPVDLMAFEPTGRLRRGARGLSPGDRALPVGPRKQGQINLEKLLCVPGATGRPTRCPGCGGRMGSTGRVGPRRCARCGTRREAKTRTPAPRWHEAAPSARRHLARPLALGLADHVADAAEALLGGDPVRPTGTLT